ncbi:TRAP transporter substrate-binding protein, partial [Thermodesulfobacteriota bacterium]
MFLITLCGSALSADKVNINFASEYGPPHPSIKNGIMPWIDDVKKMSGGKLQINYFAPNALTPQREHFGAVVSGAVDMSFSPPAFTPGKFPLSGVLNLPILFTNAESGARVAMDLYNKYPNFKAEYTDFKFLWMHISALFELHTTKKLVKSLEDLQGMKIIVWLPPARVMAKALGANPVEVTPADSYLALERGMADGVFCPLAPIREKKISDSAKYHTMFGLMANPFWGAINPKKYNSMAPELKKIIDDTTGLEMALKFGRTLDEGAARDEIAFKKEGHTFYYLPPKEKDRWVAKVSGIHDKWVADMEAKGHKNAKEMRATAIELSKKYGK